MLVVVFSYLCFLTALIVGSFILAEFYMNHVEQKPQKAIDIDTEICDLFND